MRKIIPDVVCMLIFNLFFFHQSFAQVNKSSLAVSAGNNGQIDKILDHYLVYNGVMFLTQNNISTSFQKDMKFSLHIKLGNDSIADWNFKGSYGSHSGTFDNDDLLSNGKYSQVIISISAGRNWNLKMRKFILSAGIAIPLYNIGNFTEDFDENYGNYGWHVSYTNEGGWVSGINGLTSVKYSFTKHFFMFSEITAGLLYSQTGKETVQTISEKYGNVPGLVFPYNATQAASFTDLFFSKPEYCIGAGISF